MKKQKNTNRILIIISHKQFSGLPTETDPKAYSFLCPDGHLQPLSVATPCVWVSKPWPAVAVQPKYADRVQTMLANINHDDENSWQNALLSLMETYHVNITTLDRTIPIDDYLDQAIGFQSAYSFPACSPPRSIVVCTTTPVEHYKCSWLQEAASVYGIEPTLQCVKRERIEACMSGVQHGAADVVMADHDQLIPAELEQELMPLLSEYAMSVEAKYMTVAVVKAGSDIHSVSDLRGKRVCFPSFEGAAYMSAWETFRNLSLTRLDGPCPSAKSLEHFFGHDSCTWTEGKKCEDKYRGDLGALRCLVEGRGDVAFTDLAVFQNLTQGHINEPWVLQVKSVSLLCPFGRRPKHESDPCYLHWMARSSVMVRRNLEAVRKTEIYNALREMDKLFGKQYKTNTIPFTMFGPFDRQSNVMFRDSTDGLRSEVEMERDRLPRLLTSTKLQGYRQAKAACVVDDTSGGRRWPDSSSFLWAVIVGGHMLAMCSLLVS